MRLYSAYINRKAAEDANSVFASERYVQCINKDGAKLWELAKREQKDDAELETAERDVKINDIEREEREELQDIEDVANESFHIIRDAILVVHTQLDELKKLVKEDEVLKQSGFPIEVADQLEEMLKSEITNIIAHLREMSEDIVHEDDHNSSA
jgi:hypothetical protein